MPSDPRSIELAAQCWCEPYTSGIEIDSRLAVAFAVKLAQARAEGFRDGIERAAQECEERAVLNDSVEFDELLIASEQRAIEARECATAIRALAPVPDSHEEPCYLSTGHDGHDLLAPGQQCKACSFVAQRITEARCVEIDEYLAARDVEDEADNTLRDLVADLRDARRGAKANDPRGSDLRGGGDATEAARAIASNMHLALRSWAECVRLAASNLQALAGAIDHSAGFHVAPAPSTPHLGSTPPAGATLSPDDGPPLTGERSTILGLIKKFASQPERSGGEGK